MPLILGTNSIKDTGYNVANSLRFNDGDSPYLSQTISASTGKIFTLSFWMKKSTDGSNNGIFGLTSDGNTDDYIEVATKSGSYGLDIQFSNGSGGTYLRRRTNRVFRDTSAWMHVVVRFDSTQGTASNRFRLYINGVQETSIDVDSSAADVPQDYVTDLATNGATLNIGRMVGASNYYDGYLCEFVLVDGSSLAPTSFGEFDEDTPTIWKPKDVSDLTFGTNGFYLDFEDSSALGNDAAGSNNFTANNLAATDQSTDTCTNNFATMNPLDNFYPASTFTEGNLKIVSGSSPYSSNTATFGLSSGKWYYEFKYLARGGSEDLWHVGIKSTQDTANDQMLGHFANDYGYRAYNGKVRNNNGDITYGNTFAINDIIGVYIDLDNSKLYFAKNGTVQNSGTGISITAVASTPLGVYLPAISWNDGSTTGTCSLNFGSPEFSISSGNTDANGYGNFEYDPSSGTFDSASKSFYAINTKNLAEFG